MAASYVLARVFASHAGTPGGARDIVGEDWVMTDISGADAPAAQTGAVPQSLAHEQWTRSPADLSDQD